MATKKFVNTNSLNLRSAAATTASILAELKRGTIVSSLSSTDGWDKVKTKIGTKTFDGFVSSQFLSLTPPAKIVLPSDPLWITHARTFINLREVPGSKNNPTILSWFSKIATNIRDDETAWCAAFVGGVFEEKGIKSSRSAAARSFLKWGVGLSKPALGSVVVFWRGSPDGWSGHVGFVVGKDQTGNIMVLGGNQGDMVSIKPFATSRVLGYRWPTDVSLPTSYELPLLDSDGKVSTNEA